jgi:CRISPR-associated exonuclease Cas4
MRADSELLMISSLQHIVFCERQWALIHIEQIWQENVLTIEGKQMHENTDSGLSESRPELRIERSLRLRSLKLGLTGVADVVEFHREVREGKVFWQPFPVEYKRGKKRPDVADEVQLCAQAICLEEMLGIDIPRGAVFYGQPRRRTQVEFGNELRARVAELCQHARQMIETGELPPPRLGSHCKNCSLLNECMPKITDSTEKGKAEKYIQKLLKEIADETIA